LELLIDILTKIEQPLLFSSRDGYKHLPLVKDLEATVMNLLTKMLHALPEAGNDGEAGPVVRGLIDKLQALVQRI